MRLIEVGGPEGLDRLIRPIDRVECAQPGSARQEVLRRLGHNGPVLETQIRCRVGSEPVENRPESEQGDHTYGDGGTCGETQNQRSRPSASG